MRIVELPLPKRARKLAKRIGKVVGDEKKGDVSIALAAMLAHVFSTLEVMPQELARLAIALPDALVVLVRQSPEADPVWHDIPKRPCQCEQCQRPTAPPSTAN